MKCPKCKESAARGKSMSSGAQAFFEGEGIVPVYLCTCCGCSKRRVSIPVSTELNDMPFLFDSYEK